MYSGVGGQLDFTIGAMLAQHGRAVTLLPSTARQGSVSRIVPLHPEGTVISVPRTYVNYVVTEYGVVNLLGKSQRERAALLISVAHPAFAQTCNKPPDGFSGPRTSVASACGRGGSRAARLSRPARVRWMPRNLCGDAHTNSWVLLCQLGS